MKRLLARALNRTENHARSKPPPREHPVSRPLPYRGVPGRHELDNTQEITYVDVMNAIADLTFPGYVAHEFVPTRDPLTSLREAVDLCDV